MHADVRLLDKHSGEVERQETLVAGPTVEAVNSLTQLAERDQILVSRALKFLVAGSGIFFEEIATDQADRAAKAGLKFVNTSATEDLVILRYFGPEVNPQAPNVGDYKNA